MERHLLRTFFLTWNPRLLLGIEEGCIVEISGGAFRGQAARVTRVAETKEEVTVELFEAAVPVALTVRADQVRVTQRVE